MGGAASCCRLPASRSPHGFVHLYNFRDAKVCSRDEEHGRGKRCRKVSPARSPLVPLTRDVPAPYTEAGAARRGQDRLTVAFRPGNQAGPAVSQTRCRGRLRPREADGRGRGEPKLTPRRERLASGPALTLSAAPRTRTGAGGRWGSVPEPACACPSRSLRPFRGGT